MPLNRRICLDDSQLCAADSAPNTINLQNQTFTLVDGRVLTFAELMASQESLSKVDLQKLSQSPLSEAYATSCQFADFNDWLKSVKDFVKNSVEDSEFE